MQSITNTPLYQDALYPSHDLENEAPLLSASQSSEATTLYQDDDSMGSQDAAKRRRRTSPEELSILEAEYARCSLPDAKNRTRIGNMTNMSARSVQIWFQNKRQTDKRKAAGITRRPPRRSMSSTLLPLTSDTANLGWSESEASKKKRKTLDECASDAQWKLPTSPIMFKESEIAAALAIARMHSAPFNPNRATLSSNPGHPVMTRFHSTASLPAFTQQSEPPSLLRAYSMPYHSSHQQEDPIWKRMLSSPATSPYAPPLSRKRALDASPLLRAVKEDGPEDAGWWAKRTRLTPIETGSVEMGSPVDIEFNLSDTASTTSSLEPITPQASLFVDPISIPSCKPSVSLTRALSECSVERNESITSATDEVKNRAVLVGWELEAAELLCFMAAGKGETARS